MSTTTLASREEDPPLVRAHLYLEVFTILFNEFFQGPGSRWVARGVRAKAHIFLRALEAIVRRMFLVQAVAMVATLPPAAARPAGQRRTPPAPKSGSQTEAPGPSRFRAFRPADFSLPARRIGGPARAPLRPAALADLRPLARRYSALYDALQNPEVHVRRLALRLRAVQARRDSLQLFSSPRVHPEHQIFLERDLHACHEDANDALRALVWNSS